MSVLARPNVMPIAVSKETGSKSETIVIERSVNEEYRWAQCSIFNSGYQDTCFLREGNTNGRLGRVLGMLTHIYRVR